MSVLILAANWPTWLTICPSLNFSLTAIVCDNKTSRFWISQLLPQVPIFPSKLLKPVHFQGIDLLLVCGSVDWLTTHLPSPLPAPTLCVLDFVTNPPSWSLFGLAWRRFYHSSVGGVTDGAWYFGSTYTPPNDIHLPMTYSRTLRTILSSTVKDVRAAAAPTNPDASYSIAMITNNVLHPGGLLPLLRASSIRVCCPSVFTASHWCLRQLTVYELATAMDLPESFATSFRSSFANSTAQLPFLTAAPSKLLRAVYLAIYSIGLTGGVRLPTSISSVEFSADTLPSSTRPRKAGVLSEGSESSVSLLDCPGASLSLASSANISSVSSDDENLVLLLNNGSPGSVESNRQKAAKNDDAPVPTVLWDKLLWSKLHPVVWQQAADFVRSKQENPLDVIRTTFFLPLWRKRIWRSWRSYVHRRSIQGDYEETDRIADSNTAAQCLHYVAKCTWWEWKGGSMLFFWRWPEPIRLLARDGMPTCIKGELPRYRVPQAKPRNPEDKEMVAGKVGNVYDKGYVGPGMVLSLTSYFYVPKGIGDIRMVYDATKCGLNAVIWVPSFSLPDADSLLDIVEGCSWMADIDIGEMFLNFPLDKLLQPYCGVDFGPYLPEVLSWLRWLRCAMGLKPSPYIAIRFLLLGSEIIRGWRKDPKNALRYDEVRLNLPGMEQYDPSLPWVSKILSDTKRIASDYVGYVDDLRPVGESEEACNLCARRVSCMLGYLGIQDASRKRQGASKAAGVWAGAVVFADENGVGVNCTQEKWDKAKEYLNSLQNMIDTGDPINHKSLERIRGFLLYVTRTYPSMVPFQKGIHLTLDSWRPGRDSDGWRYTMAELRARYEFEKGIDLDSTLLHSKGAPEFVEPSTRLSDDIATLRRMTSADTPPRRFVRSRLIVTACYGFGDASGSGFGSTISGRNGLRYRHGLWARDSQKRSSNYRELRNLVEAIEEGVEDNTLQGAELFLFTDNTVAEAAFYKGNTSSSKVLFELIVRLRLIEMSGSVKLWVIHVAGSRMIQQGADGLSRGNLLEGVMTGVPMLEYVPLSVSALQRSPSISEWLATWCPSEPHILTPEDWYFKGHGMTGGAFNEEHVWIPTSTSSGLFVWDPPPAAARAAIDQLSVSHHKRPSLTHVFICPRLFTSLWRKRLYKLADCVVYIPAGSRPFWPKEMFEPLILGLLLPFSSTPPWQYRRSPQILELEGQLRQVWSKQDGSEQPVLRKFFNL